MKTLTKILVSALIVAGVGLAPAVYAAGAIVPGPMTSSSGQVVGDKVPVSEAPEGLVKMQMSYKGQGGADKVVDTYMKPQDFEKFMRTDEVKDSSGGLPVSVIARPIPYQPGGGGYGM